MWKPKFKFRLRTLLLLVTIAAIVLAIWGNLLYRNYRENWAADAIQAAGAKIQRVDERVVRVYVGDSGWDNAKIKELIPHLKQLYKLRELDLVRVELTDEGLQPFAELVGLKELYVFETGLSEAGIKRLGELLPGTKVSTEEPDPIASGMAGTIIYPHAIVALAWAPDGKVFATGSGDGHIRIWKVDSALPVADWRAHEKWTFGIEFSPNGKLIATGGADEKVRLWDALTHQLIAELNGHTDDIHAVAFTPDSAILVTASDDRTIRVWDVAKRETIRVLTGHQAQIPSMDVSADGKWIASASRDDTVRVWELETGATLAVLESETDIDTRDSEVAVSKSENSRFGKLRFKDSRQGDMLSVAFQANGRRLAAGGNDGKVRIWSQADFRLLESFDGDPDRVYRVAFHPTADIVLASGDSGIRAVNLAKNSIRDLDEQEMVSQLAFHPQGNRLVSANASGEIHLIDFPSLETGKVLRTNRAERGLDFSAQSVE